MILSHVCTLSTLFSSSCTMRTGQHPPFFFFFFVEIAAVYITYTLPKKKEEKKNTELIGLRYIERVFRNLSLHALQVAKSPSLATIQIKQDSHEIDYRENV